MEIGAISVRLDAQTAGLTTGVNKGIREFQRFDGSVKRSASSITSATKGAFAPTNQLASVFTSLASQATGASPALVRLGSVVGQFALGGGVVAIALAAVTALSAAWNFFTREARAAKEETEKLITKLVDLGKAKAAATVPGLQAQRVGLQSQFDAAVKARDVAQRRSIQAGGEQTSGLLKAREDVLRLSAALLVNEQEIRKAKDAFDQMWTSAQSIDGVTVSVEKLTPLLERIAALKLDLGFGGAIERVRALNRKPPALPTLAKTLPARITAPAPGEELKDARSKTATDVLGQLTGAFESLKATLGPMAIVGEFLNGVFAGLAPVLDALMVPIRDIGFLIGASISPVLKALQPILNAVAKAFSFVIEGIGFFLKGLGKAIDALPFVGDLGLIKTGQGLIDLAKGTRAAIDSGTDLTKTMDKINGSMSNVPSGFKVALARFNATSPTVSGSAGTRSAVAIGTVNVYANDPEGFVKKLRQAVRRGGAPGLEPAY